MEAAYIYTLSENEILRYEEFKKCLPAITRQMLRQKNLGSLAKK